MKFISLFSGAGGLDLGFEQTGFKPVIAYDNKRAAIKTYNHKAVLHNKVKNYNFQNSLDIYLKSFPKNDRFHLYFSQ